VPLLCPVFPPLPMALVQGLALLVKVGGKMGVGVSLRQGLQMLQPGFNAVQLIQRLGL
jgi:hypothetical protein